jgi:hypothetical protein
MPTTIMSNNFFRRSDDPVIMTAVYQTVFALGSAKLIWPQTL